MLYDGQYEPGKRPPTDQVDYMRAGLDPGLKAMNRVTSARINLSWTDYIRPHGHLDMTSLPQSRRRWQRNNDGHSIGRRGEKVLSQL